MRLAIHPRLNGARGNWIGNWKNRYLSRTVGKTRSHLSNSQIHPPPNLSRSELLLKNLKVPPFLAKLVSNGSGRWDCGKKNGTLRPVGRKSPVTEWEGGP